MLALALALSVCQPPAAHDAQNPLYKALLDPGHAVGAGHRAKLPAPIMPDGLDAAAQAAVIAGLVKDNTTRDEFVRKSAVAPHLLRLRDVLPSDPAAPARGVDVYFVVHGDLSALDDEAFRSRLLDAGRGGGAGKALSDADLAKRGITVGDPKREGYGRVETDFLDKVRVRAAGRAVWSRTAESAVAAVETDARLAADAEFPTDWRPLTKENGEAKVGPPAPWAGAGLYLKATKLADPAGALFVEQHVVFAEPAGWFNGANLLRSKLPPVVQSNVRATRREWAKGR